MAEFNRNYDKENVYVKKNKKKRNRNNNYEGKPRGSYGDERRVEYSSKQDTNFRGGNDSRRHANTGVREGAVRMKALFQNSCLTLLPVEILLKIVSEYHLSPRDLISLSLSCKFLSTPCFGGICLAEEAARLSTPLIVRSYLPLLVPRGLERVQRGEKAPSAYSIFSPASGETWLKLYSYLFKRFLTFSPRHEDLVMCSAGGSHSAVVREGDLYTFGVGKNGQLGLGYKIIQLDPTLVNVQPYGRDYKRRGLRVERVAVKSVSCGALHTALTSGEGELYTCGINSSGELGYTVPSDEDPEYYPCYFNGVPLPESVYVQSVECGDHHTAFIADTGLLYTFGGNEHGQLGVGDFSSRREPTLVEDLIPFMCLQVSAFTHTAVTTACGQLFTFGDGFHGQLGIGRLMNSPVPMKVSVPSRRILHVAAGHSHTLIVTSEGDLYSCGWKAQGQLGIVESNSRMVVAEPVRVRLPGRERARKVWAGMSHSLALSEDGRLYVWGRNVFGELGLKGVFSESWQTPECIQTFQEPVCQASGGANHTLAVARDGSVFSWGSGAKGRLGTGSTLNRIVPDKIAV